MRLIFVLLMLLPATVLADTAYVTDNLRLGLHTAEDTSDRAFRFLESGQAMEVLTRDRNYANVRLPDGTEGWVKSAYLVSEKPAKLIVAETMEERDRLARELEQAREALADPTATIDELRDEAAKLSSELEDARSQVSALEDQQASVEALKERYRGSVPFSWVGGVIAVCLVAGFLLGLRWVDYRSRKRHGGIRIY